MKRNALIVLALAVSFGCSSPSDNADNADNSMSFGDDAGTTDAAEVGNSTLELPYDTGPDFTECAPFATLGPHPVGVRDITLGGHEVAVFYPADAPGEAFASYDLRDWMPPEEAEKISDDVAPPFEYPGFVDLDYASGPFPVVLFSHGFGGYRMQSSVLTSMIASWGYVVLAPEHPERNLTKVLEIGGAPMEDFSAATLVEVMDAIEAEAANETELGAVVDVSQLAVTGHSAGGFAAMSVGDDERVDLVVSWASGAFEEVGEFAIPSVVMGGSVDRLASANAVRELYASRTPPKLLLSIDNAGHLAFSDICLIGREDGGVLQIAEDSGVDVPQLLKLLGKDGCLPQDLPPELSWPLISHATVANLEYRFNDGDAVETATIEACFGDLVFEVAAEE